MRFIVLTLSLAILLAPMPVSAFPWSVDMYREPAVQPLARAPRVMPSGTTPVRGGEAPRSRIAYIRVHNPLPATAANIERGRQLYAITCEPCHGADGKGDGPVRFLLRVPPIDLTGGSATGMSGGYIYGTIRNGSVIMPPYADALSINERWEVVLFVRSLQGKLAAK